jgi:hypothetical protein
VVMAAGGKGDGNQGQRDRREDLCGFHWVPPSGDEGGGPTQGRRTASVKYIPDEGKTVQN